MKSSLVRNAFDLSKFMYKAFHLTLVWRKKTGLPVSICRIFVTTFLGFGANEARARHHRKLFLAGLLRFPASHYSHYPDHVSISSPMFSSFSSCTSQRRCSSRAGRRPPTERPLPPSWHERQHQVGGFVVGIINLTFFNFPSAAFLLTFPPSACLVPTSSLRSRTRK